MSLSVDAETGADGMLIWKRRIRRVTALEWKSLAGSLLFSGQILARDLISHAVGADTVLAIEGGATADAALLILADFSVLDAS